MAVRCKGLASQMRLHASIPSTPDAILIRSHNRSRRPLALREYCCCPMTGQTVLHPDFGDLS
jgi:hypothetical protein